MARELKKTSLTIRMRESAKRTLQGLADEDDVSVSAMVERLVKAEVLRRQARSR